MTTILQCLNDTGVFSFRNWPGEVGIEIETESKSSYNIPMMKLWATHRDNSLRDFGVEYVSAQPLTREQIRPALEEWNEKVQKPNKLVPDSITTSVHVHINFLKNKWIHLANFITTYYLVENLLIKYSGTDRLSNLFCLPICDAEGELEGACTLIRNIGGMRHKNIAISPDQYKYSGLNLAAFSHLGTAEVRIMRGTINIVEIEEWVNMLLSIKDFACVEGRTPIGIIQMFEEQGVEILYPIFGQYTSKLVVKDREALIKQNLYYASKVATSSKIRNADWGFPKPKPILKEKLLEKLEVISQSLYKVEYKKLPFEERFVVEERLARDMNLNPANLFFLNEDR